MLIDVLVLKPFAGLLEGQYTQLNEEQFKELSDQGYCQNISSAKAVKDTDIDTKKVVKK